MKPIKSPTPELKYLRKNLQLTVPQVPERAVSVFLWLTLVPISSASLIYLTITNNYLLAERLATLLAVTIIAILAVSKPIRAFLVCVAMYEASGQKPVMAIHAALHSFGNGKIEIRSV